MGRAVKAVKGRSRLRTRLLLALVAVSVPPLILLAALVLILFSRNFDRTARVRLEAGSRAVEARTRRLAAEAAAKVEAVVREDLPAVEEGAPHEGLAGEWARRRGLPALEVVSAEGVVISSHHFPVGFGLPDDDAVFASSPFRLEKISEGYGVATRLVVTAERPATLGGAAVVVRGGYFIDAGMLEEVAELLGAEVALVDAGHGRWIAPGRSLLPQWKAGLSAGDGIGEAILGGRSFLWMRKSLAQDLGLVVAIPRAAIVEVMGNVGRVTVGVAAAALLGALVAAVFLSARIAAPVQELAAGADRVAGGDLGTPVPSFRDDDLGALATAFNRMTEELRTSRERLLQAERVAAWREMARRLAHELKNPIFPIQLSIETLRRAAADQKGRERFLEHFDEASLTILDELRVLRSIVDEFSQFARMPPPRLAAVDVNRVVDHALRTHEPRAGAVEVRRELGEVPPLQADGDQLSRAVGNLIANAFDALDGAGTLTVRTRGDAGGVRIEIEDTGPGLSEEERTRLFTPYYTTKKGGTGLGLAIAQGIVSDHQGRIEVKSERGAGTAFSLWLPA